MVVTKIIPVEGDDSQLSSDNEHDEAYNPPVESDDSSTDDKESNSPTTSTSLSKTKNTKVKRRLLLKTAKDYNPHEEKYWFGHVARDSPELDRHRALYAAVHGQPRDWKRRSRRPANTWTSTVEADLKLANFSLFSAWR